MLQAEYKAYERESSVRREYEGLTMQLRTDLAGECRRCNTTGLMHNAGSHEACPPNLAYVLQVVQTALALICCIPLLCWQRITL